MILEKFQLMVSNLSHIKFSMCLRLWCKIFFKIVFRFKIHLNIFLFRHQHIKIINIEKNINLMYFQFKNTFKKYIKKTEA